MVMGTWVKLSPANSTRPMLSWSRPLTNWVATFLALSKRLGEKSLASILVDTSMAMTMSVPSTSLVDQLSLVCGRHRMTMRHASAAILRANEKCLSHTFQLVPMPSNARVDDTFISGSFLSWL